MALCEKCGKKLEASPNKLSERDVIRIRRFLRQGKENEWIQAELGVTRQQVAAVKAHMTMKTYG